MMWRNKYILTALLLFITGMCSLFIVKAGNAYNLQKGGFSVVTSFYPMYIATINITDGVEGVNVKNLTNNSTGCLHDYQLSTKDLKLLDDTDLLVVNGGGMENFLDDVFSQYEDLDVVTATEGLELLEEDGEGYNAHSWMSISLYIQEVEAIADALIKYDPTHREQYEENLNNYKYKLQELEKLADSMNQSAMTMGNNGKENGVAVFHEAFEYLESLCNFKIEELVDMDENTALSAAQISDIINKVNTGQIKYILADYDNGKDAAEAIEKECMVKVIYLDALTSGEADKDAYVDGMSRNLELLREAFEL